MSRYYKIISALTIIQVISLIFTGANNVEIIEATVEVIKADGYKVETHYVTTADGYILTVFRLPYQRNDNSQSKLPVLVSHGMMTSAYDWIVLGPKKSLGYILADNGYDVWLMNSRGNHYSTNHTTLYANDSAYWNFSFHEMGVFDMPAVIDYITNVTEQTEIIHIGHSQGCTAFYIMLSERPEYNNKVKAHFGYAPAAYLCHTSTVNHLAASLENTRFFSTIRQLLGDFDVSQGRFFKSMNSLCKDISYLSDICFMAATVLANITPEQLNPKLLPVIFKYYPSGSSSKQVVHYMQLINSCEFAKYQNSVSEKAVLYNISNIKVPYIYLFAGEADIVQSPKDTARLANELTNGFKKLTYLKNWRHGDYVMGKDADKLVYQPTVDLINQLHDK